MCTVVNKYKSPYDIYIGRGSKWGNPFVLGRDGDRNTVIQLYRKYLWEQINSSRGSISIADLRALHGKRLGCFCKPKACHGDVIKAAVEWAMNQ